MRRFLGSKAASDKGKQRQRDPEGQSYDSYDIPALMSTPVEVLVEREVASLTHDDQESSQPFSSSSTLVPPSPSGSARKQLPPGIRVPTHPYPYWHNHTPTSSQSSLESPVTPSHVSWLSGSATNPAGPSTPPGTSTSPAPAPAPAPGRSSPNLFFPPPPPTAPPANAGRSKLIPMKSTHSLRVPGQEFQFGQLSPIVEQDYMSPEKRPVSLPSSSHEDPGTRSSTTHTMMTPVSPSALTPVSPLPMNPVFSLAGGSVPIPPGPSYGGLVPFVKRRDEEGGDSPRPSPVFSNFISRPLNRSISLSSTRTHQSGGSASTPPVIPPLDFQPPFPGPLFPTTTPTSLRGHDGFSLSDRESNSDRRESFATAKTGNRESRYSSTQQEHFVDAESGPRTPHSSQESSQSGRHGRPQPPPPVHLPPTTSCRPSSHQSSHRPTAPSLHSLTSLPSASSSFIDKRFADSELYLGSAVERDNARKAGQRWAPKAGRGDIIQVLFWIGFIAPWCWLIGGWVIEPRSPAAHASRGHGGGLLPLWTGKGKNVQRMDSVKMQHGYPFVAPSVTSLTPVSYSRVVLTPKPLNPPKNPWVRRCRIAAVTSGLIIVVAFVTTLIIVSTNSG